MSDITNFLSQSDNNPARLHILAVGTSLCYNFTATDQFDAYKTAIGATSYARTAQGQFRPPFVVYQLANNTRLFLFSGIENYSQLMRYLVYSNGVACTSSDGNVANCAEISYNTNRAAMVAAATQNGTAGNKSKVIIAAHSAGGNYAQMLAADLVKNHATTTEVKSVTLFGCPRVGDADFNLTLANTPVLNIRHAEDPVPRWPQFEIHGQYTVIDSSGARRVVRQTSVFSSAGTLYQLERGNIWEIPTFSNQNSTITMQVAHNLISQALLHDDHKIENYILRLFHLGAGIRNPDNNVPIQQLRETLANLQLVETPDQPADVVAPAVSLPQVRPTGQTPAIPSGGSVAQGRGIVVFRPAVNLVYGEIGGTSSSRAVPGDGHAERVIKDMITDMQFLSQHADGVNNGTKRGTDLLFNKAVANDEVREKWDAIYEHLAKLPLD